MVLVLAVPAVVAVFSLLLEYGVVQQLFDPDPPEPAGAPVVWDSKATSADVAGVHANGNVQPLDDGSVLLNGTLTDTAKDANPVRFEAVAVGVDGKPVVDVDGRPVRLEQENHQGAGRQVGVVAGGPAANYRFQGDLKSIRINECVVERQGRGQADVHKCGRPAVIWTAP